MAFYLDDIPAEPLVVDPPENIDLAQFTAASAEIIAPDAVTTPLTAEIEDDVVTVTLPATTVFAVEGIHRLRITLNAAAAVQRLPEVRIVAIDPDSQWHTLDTIREDWTEAENLPDSSLYELLEIVRGQVTDYAPALADDDPVPTNYRYGQRVHARNTWNAAKVAPDGGFGGDDFVIRPFPLDWHVKQILRPKKGTPVVA